MKLAVIYLTFLAFYLCERAYALPPPTGRGYVYVKAETINNGQFTRYFKVGATGSDRTTGRNTDNWRPIKALEYIQVTKTREAEKKAHEALEEWHVKQGGGTEWYKVPENQVDDFVDAFFNAIEKYLE